MSVLFNAIKGNTYSTTFNGAKTLPNSGNSLVDLFAAIGSSRGKDISSVFTGAFGHDEVANILAVRILLWARDIRGGAGERETFRKLIKIVEKRDKVLTKAIIRKIPEVGRWDDLFSFSEKYAVDFAYDLIAKALLEQSNGLCAKWMPRKGKIAVDLRNYMGLSPRDYRRTLVDLTNVVETHMCAKQWDGINYEHVPSVASSRYSKAFKRNDLDRYNMYLSSLEKGTAKVNASAIFPYDIINSMKRGNVQISDAQWKALPDYIGDNADNVLCIVDTSGSMESYNAGNMSVSCMDVALSLGMYVSERSKGIFKDKFITFSTTPSLQEIKGAKLSTRYENLKRAHWSMSTDFNKVFKVILDAAVANRISEKDMPTKILVFSDMEFNRCGGNQTNFQAIETMYKKAGYKRPDIVFWNLNAREGNSPVRFDQGGTALVSGFSPSLMKSILSGTSCTPFSMMMETIMSERYDLVL